MKYFLTIIILFWTGLVFGQSTTINGGCTAVFDTISNRTIYSLVDSLAEFPGGIDSLTTFIRNNLSWPNTEVDFSGKVFISFIVETDGSLTNKIILRGIETSVDEEALKVIEKMPKWKPAICDGNYVASKYIVPVIFRLE